MPQTAGTDSTEDEAQEIRHDLRAESDAIMGMVATLREIENKKRHSPPGSEEFLWYAERVEELSHVVADLSERETEMAKRAARAPGRSGATLAETEPPPSVPHLLDEWRAAERRLSLVDPTSDEAKELGREIGRLREQYRKAIDAAVTGTGTSPSPGDLDT
jgi:hypothetical protein